MHRKTRRVLLGLGFTFGVLLFTGCEVPHQTFAVTTTADGGDADPGDGICEMTPGVGDCSLRAAVDEANVTPTLSIVAIPPGTYGLDGPSGDDGNAGGDLDLYGAIVLAGSAPDVVVDAQGNDRVLDNRSPFAVVVDLTLTGGSTAGDGGGLRNAGQLTLGYTTISDNTAEGSGGGVEATGGKVALRLSTVSDNVAGVAGGGVHTATGATFTAESSTVSGNEVDPTTAGGAPLTIGGGPAAGLNDPLPADGDAADGTDGTTPSVGPDARGRLPVIVELAVDTRPETDLSASSVAQQRAGIAATAQRVTTAADLAGPDVRTYLTLPYVALAATPDQIAALETSPEVRSVVPDELSAPALAQSIPWVNADDAHAAGTSGAGQVVAVLDSGVDSDHLMTDGKVVAEACFARGPNFGDAVGDCPNGLISQTGTGAGENCPQLTASCWHGTHVATTAAGSPVVAGPDQLVGVAPTADLIAVNVFSYFTGTGNCSGAADCIRSYVSDQLAGLDFVYALRDTHDIAAVNMSLGGGSHAAPCDTDTRKPVIDDLRAAGIATVISSGNSSLKTATGAPGCISTAITVGASGDTSDTVASFSNSAWFLDLLAPGVSITAGYPTCPCTVTASGTSMAAPHVAGAVALLGSVDPDATVDEIEAALEDGGVPVTDTANAITTPRLDVTAAIGAIGGAGRGGGIANDGTLDLESVTITDNAAAWGGGLANAGVADVRGSVLANQLVGADCADVGGSFTSSGWNLDADSSCGLDAPGDLPGTDPVLGPLADNGGSTETHLPALSSPLREAIPVGTPLLCDGTQLPDQMDVTRPVGTHCDIGAVEQ